MYFKKQPGRMKEAVWFFVTLKHFLKLVVSPSERTKWHSLMCLTVKHAAVQRYHVTKMFST